MNIIFGSGIIGLMARHILGPSWRVVPFYRSRFFSFNPALDDNFLSRHEELDPLIQEFQTSNRMYLYRRVWSIGGQLIGQYDSGLCGDWMNKLFAGQVPHQAPLYFKDQMVVSVYDLRLHELYLTLMARYINEIKEESTKGVPTEIGDHYFVRDGKREDYTKAVSTIPLNTLLKLLKIEMHLPTLPMHYIHVESPDPDFEGANQALIVDPQIEFMKVTNIAPNRYLFYLPKELPHPGMYLRLFMQQFDILDGTSLDNVIPQGQTPNLTSIEKMDIMCVGSNAQHDWCMDVGSCFLRLLRYAGRSAKMAKPKILMPGDLN
jgi:hypothetical protein